MNYGGYVAFVPEYENAYGESLTSETKDLLML